MAERVRNLIDYGQHAKLENEEINWFEEATIIN